MEIQQILDIMLKSLIIHSLCLTSIVEMDWISEHSLIFEININHNKKQNVHSCSDST